MPVGYMFSGALVAALAWAAVTRRRPRHSSPFRLSGLLGFLLNWPLALVLALAASTALAIGQSGVGSPGFWVGLGLHALAALGLVLLARRALATGTVVERALDEGLGAGRRDRPTLVYLHAGAFRFGSKRVGARHLLHRLAADGWVAHGDQDRIVVVEDARRFVERLRAESPNPVVYAELPAAQHGFDMFRSRRLEIVIDATEAFAAQVTRPVSAGAAIR